VPPKPRPELDQREAPRICELKSALRPLAHSRDFERKSAGLNIEPSGPVKAARCGSHSTELPLELSSEDFEEIVEVFRILKRWRDESGRGGR
jgi:hypothetical protein